jgi:hypothetical protein
MKRRLLARERPEWVFRCEERPSYPGKRASEPLRPRKRHAADARRDAQRPEDLSWTMFGKKGVENKPAALIPLGKFRLTRIWQLSRMKSSLHASAVSLITVPTSRTVPVAPGEAAYAFERA